VKKLWSLAIIEVVLLGSIAACARSSSDASSSGARPKTVTVVKLLDNAGAYKLLTEKKIEEYNNGVGKDRGVKIDIETLTDRYREVLLLAIRSGNPPDLFAMPAGLEASYIASGWVMPLEDVPGSREIITRFRQYLKTERHIHGGKTYALPLEVLPIKMAYNRDLFRKAGIVDAKGEPTPPKTWAEVAQYAKRITDASSGAAYGFGHCWAFVVGYRRLLFKPFIASIGHFWFDHRTGRYNFKDFAPALEFMMQTKNDRSCFPGAESLDMDPLRAQFAEGRIGMFIAASYEVAVFSQMFPTKVDWAICDMPVMDPNNRYKEVMLDRVNVSISSSVTKERLPGVFEAFKFMHDKKFYQYLYENCAIIPHEQDIITSAGNVQNKTGWKAMSADLSKGYTIFPWPDSLLTLEGPSHKEVLDRVWLGELSIDTALADLEKRYNEALDRAIKEGKITISNYIFKEDIRLTK